MSPGVALAQADNAESRPADVTSPPPPPVRRNPSRSNRVGSRQQEAQDSQLMFELMIAELAGRRGQLDVAMAGYLRAASHTDDPRVAERATRLTLFGRQWEEAEKMSRRWLDLAPGTTEANEMLAQSLCQQGKSDEAAAIFIELIDASTDKTQTYGLMAGELQALEDPAQAVKIMQLVKEAFPDDAKASLGLARAQVATGDNESALQTVEQALVLDDSDERAVIVKSQILISLGRPDEGFEVIEAFLDANPDTVSLRLTYAQLLVQAGRFDSVSEQLEVLYNKASATPETLLTISVLAIDAKRLEQAKTYLTTLMDTGQFPDQANFYLARISDQQQDYPAAIDYYDAVQPGDLHLTAQIRVAELLGITGELQEGRRRLHQMASSLPNPALQPQLLTAEGRMLQTAGQPAEAVKVLTKGLEQFPSHSDLLYARALAADGAGDENMLVADLTALIDVDPENAHALNALGYHLADNNTELDRAEALLIKANALLPNDPAIMDSLGWLRYRQGNFDEAIELLTRAYQLYPDTEIAAHLGEALWLSGQEEGARKLLEGALEDNPEDDKLLLVIKKYIK